MVLVNFSPCPYLYQTCGYSKTDIIFLDPIDLTVEDEASPSGYESGASQTGVIEHDKGLDEYELISDQEGNHSPHESSRRSISPHSSNHTPSESQSRSSGRTTPLQSHSPSFRPHDSERDSASTSSDRELNRAGTSRHSPNTYLPPKKKRSISESDSDYDNGGGNIANWTNSQVEAWDCTSWASHDSDDDAAHTTVRGRQTPYSYNNEETAVEEEARVVHQDSNQYNILLDRFDNLSRTVDALPAQFRGIIDYIRPQFTTVHSNLTYSRNRSIRAVGRIESNFATLNYRLDGFESILQEILANQSNLAQRVRAVELSQQRHEESLYDFTQQYQSENHLEFMRFMFEFVRRHEHAMHLMISFLEKPTRSN